MSVSTIDYPHLTPAILTRWHVTTGDNVEEGTLLAEFEGQHDHSYITLIAPHEGQIEELLAKEGSTCTPSTQMLRVMACLHDIQYAGMCASCGKDLTVSTAQGNSKLSNVAIIHSQPRLTVTMQEAQRVDKETAGRLLKQKQLSLVLDLDHTLIHAATETHFHQFALQNRIDPKAEQLHQFFLPGSSVNYFVKLRPHLQSFLEEVSQMFELHMYTFGTRLYALKVAQIIDPEHKIFKERILSRDDCGDIDYKTLKRIFPCDDSMVVIVDDREDVWKKSKNLVRIEPFLYFVGLPDVNPHPFDRQPHHPQVPPILPGHSQPHPLHPPQRQRPPSKRAPNSRPILSSTNGEKRPEKRKDQDDRSGQQESKKPKQDNRDNEKGNVEEKEKEKEKEKEIEQNENENEKEGGKGATSITGLHKRQEQHSDPTEISEKTSESATLDVKLGTKEKEDNSLEVGPSDCSSNTDAKSTPDSPSSGSTPDLSPSESTPDSPPSESTVTQKPVTSQPSPPPQWPPPPDECLPIILDVLREVHKRFYILHDTHQKCDVKDIITTMKRSVLAGCFVVFSGFYPREVDPRVTPLGRLAETFGAVCQLDLSKNTTHLIAKKNHTDKVKTALARRITIVTENWLFASTRRWQRVPESDYCLPPEDPQSTGLSGSQSRRTNNDSKHDHKHDIKHESKHASKHDTKHGTKQASSSSHATDSKADNGRKSTKNTKEVIDLPYPEMVPSKSILEEMKQEAELFDDGDSEEDDVEHDYQDENEVDDDYGDLSKQQKSTRHAQQHYDDNNDENDDFATFLESELVNQ